MSKYVVYDLEMCKVPKGEKHKAFGSWQELIQIGAVLLDEDYRTIDTFSTFVAPRFGAIDPFIERLTGIKNTDVQNAPSTEDALHSFLAWIPEDAILVSWSENDRNQLYREIDGKQIEIPRLEWLLEDSIDCQWEFEERINATRSYGLADALSITGVVCDEGAHDALIDAQNTAILFVKLKTELVLKLSAYYMAEEQCSSGLLAKFCRPT